MPYVPHVLYVPYVTCVPYLSSCFMCSRAVRFLRALRALALCMPSRLICLRSVIYLACPTWLTRVFYKQRFFSTQSQCCLTFSGIELKMLHRCGLINTTIIILRYILYLVYLGPCLGLGLSMLYPCDLFFIFSLIFITSNSITSLKQTHLFFAHSLEYLLLFLDDNVDEESELHRVLHSFCLICCHFQS